jgi:alpha-tubulin suppressor-like RCC1 family protein
MHHPSYFKLITFTATDELYLCGLMRSPKDGSTMFESIGQGGGDLSPQPRKIDLPGDVGSVMHVSVGNYHILALTGTTQIITQVYNVFVNLAFTDNGTVLAWGSNSHGQVPFLDILFHFI